MEDVGIPASSLYHPGLHHTHLLSTDQERSAVLKITWNLFVGQKGRDCGLEQHVMNGRMGWGLPLK